MNEFLNELRDSARQVMNGAGTPAKEDSTLPLVTELGWLLAAVPEELDGLGLGVQGACMLHQELGRNLAEVAFLPATLAIDALCHSDVADKAELIGRFTTGESITASLVDSNLSLNGSSLSGVVAAIQSADLASHAVVWTVDARCVALINLEQAGVERLARPTWDETRRLFDVALTNVEVSAEQILASGDAAVALVTRLQNLRDYALAADALGGSAALIALTIEHLQTRVQFARPLAAFQALKHRCADLQTEVAAAEALFNDSLSRVAESMGSADAVFSGQKVKYLACATYAKVVEECLQLSGGIGMASEYPCHLYLKRSMLSEHLGSGNGQYEVAIADTFLRNLSN